MQELSYCPKLAQMGCKGKWQIRRTLYITHFHGINGVGVGVSQGYWRISWKVSAIQQEPKAQCNLCVGPWHCNINMEFKQWTYLGCGGGRGRTQNTRLQPKVFRERLRKSIPTEFSTMQPYSLKWMLCTLHCRLLEERSFVLSSSVVGARIGNYLRRGPTILLYCQVDHKPLFLDLQVPKAIHLHWLSWLVHPGKKCGSE